MQAPRTARSLWLAAELDLGFVWWLASRFGLRARTGGTLALARPAYHVGDRTVPTYSYTTGVLGFGATIALLVKIGRPL